MVNGITTVKIERGLIAYCHNQGGDSFNMNFSKIALALLGFSTLAGCGKEPLESCPNAGRGFIEKSVRTYFNNTYPAIGEASLNILPDENYDAAAKMWMVSVDTPDKKYFALVSCSGHVELSRKKLGSLQPPEP